MTHSGGWVLAVATGALVLACATGKSEKDTRAPGTLPTLTLPDGGTVTAQALPDGGLIPCGPPGRGQVAFVNASDTTAVACAQVKLMREESGCDGGTDCPREVLFEGLTNAVGVVKLARGVAQGVRLVAEAEGFATSYRPAFPPAATEPVVVELVPREGLLLKVLDTLGSPMTSTQVTLRQGDTVLGQENTNGLSNVYLPQRPSFEQPLRVEVDGFPPTLVSGPQDLQDGTTVFLGRTPEPDPDAGADADGGLALDGGLDADGGLLPGVPTGPGDGGAARLPGDGG